LPITDCLVTRRLAICAVRHSKEPGTSQLVLLDLRRGNTIATLKRASGTISGMSWDKGETRFACSGLYESCYIGDLFIRKTRRLIVPKTPSRLDYPVFAPSGDVVILTKSSSLLVINLLSGESNSQNIPSYTIHNQNMRRTNVLGAGF